MYPINKFSFHDFDVIQAMHCLTDLFDDMIGGASNFEPRMNWSSKCHYMTPTHTAHTGAFCFFFIRKIHPINIFCIVQLSLLDSHKNMGWFIDIPLFFLRKNLRISNTQHSGSVASRNKNVLQIDLRSSIGLKNCFWWRFPACQVCCVGKSWRVFLFFAETTHNPSYVGGWKGAMVMNHVS